MLKIRKNIKIWGILFLISPFSKAQTKDFKVATLHKLNANLEVKIKKMEIKGTCKFVLSPYFYDLKKMVFEAKNMNIQKVLLANKPLNYKYLEGKLNVFFQKKYTKKDTLQMQIQFQKKIKTKNSKTTFLLFGKLKKYCPIPEKTLYVSKQKISFKVPKNYKIIGEKNISKKQNLEKIFFAIGKFHKKTKAFKGKKYHFYSNIPFENKKIKTQKIAEMIGFFEKITGIKYPYKTYKALFLKNENHWENYHGIILKPFENKNFKDIYQIMENDFEKAVQMANQWILQIFFRKQEKFSNEKLAYFLGYLWLKKNYKPKEIEVFKNLFSEQYFENPEALEWVKNIFVFEMLAKEIGTKNLVKGIQNYFQKNQNSETFFKANLEELTGKDLHVFFEQWFGKKGYPTLEIHKDYNTIEKTIILTFEQKNNDHFAYHFPVKVKFYYKNHTDTKIFKISSLQESFKMVYKEIPKWISVNYDKSIFGKFKTSQSIKNWMYEYLHSPYYEDKKNALVVLLKRQSYEDVLPVLERAFEDPFVKNKILLLENLDLADKFSKRKLIDKIENLAQNATNPFLKAAATKALGKLISNQFYSIFIENFKENHPKIKAAALESLYYLNSKKAIKLTKNLNPEIKHSIGFPLSKLYLKQKQKEDMRFVAPYILQGIYLIKDEKTNAMFREGLFWIAESEDVNALKILVGDMVKKGNLYRKYNFHLEMIALIRKLILAQEELKTNRKPFVNILEKAIENLTQNWQTNSKR